MMRGGKKRSDEDDERETSREALRGIVRDAARARMGDRVPPSKRPAGFMISIGLADPDDELEEDEEESEKDRSASGLTV